MLLNMYHLPAVPEKQRVSMLWLEWVTESGRIIPYQQRGSVACRPFPYTLPLPGMSNIRCMSYLILASLQDSCVGTHKWLFVSNVDAGQVVINSWQLPYTLQQ